MPTANPVIAGFRDYACLETFPLNVWVVDEWLHRLEHGAFDAIATITEVDQAREQLRALRDGLTSHASTLHPPVDQAEYAEVVTRMRIYHLDDVDPCDPDEWPWQVDGYDHTTGRVTSVVENYATFEDAVASYRGFPDRHGYAVVPRPA